MKHFSGLPQLTHPTSTDLVNGKPSFKGVDDEGLVVAVSAEALRQLALLGVAQRGSVWIFLLRKRMPSMITKLKKHQPTARMITKSISSFSPKIGQLQTTSAIENPDKS